MDNKKIQFLAIVVAIVIVVAGYFIYKTSVPDKTLDLSQGIVFGDASIDTTLGSTYLLDKSIGKNPLYTDKNNKFSFSYPEGFSVGNFGGVETGETILIQRQGEKAGFQIFISLFDEPGSSLTPSRITDEVPGIVMQNPEIIEFNGKVIGISFTSESESFGPSREVWIAEGGYLYQMTSYLSDQTLLRQVLSTWKFLK